MKIAIIGGDRRFDLLAERLAARHDVLRDPAAEQLGDADAVVTQNPVRGGHTNMAEILANAPADAHLILHGSGRQGIPADRVCTDLLEIEEFVEQNAVLTAEGAISAAMQATQGALTGSVCLIIGYGRIGRALAGMLQGLGAQIMVAARRPDVRLQAKADGAEIFDTGEGTLAGAVALADYVFSTPPALLLTEKVLANVRQGVPVIDLASPPYGVDADAAQRLGVNAWRESGVPGRYCPAAAAGLMETAIERLLAGPVG